MKCLDISIGSFSYLFTLKRRAISDDGAGGQIVRPTDIAQLWMSMEPVSSNQRFWAMKLEAPVTHRLVTRWRDDVVVSPDLMLTLGERQFNIRSVINIEERNRFLDVMVEENVVQ